MFDKRLCLANIYQLAKEKNIKIGDLEKAAGVSAGYISRINKEDSNTMPTIDFIAAVAKALGVTVDAIIKNDYSTPTPTEKYILSFIDRLLSQTNEDKLDWKKESAAQLKVVGYDAQGCPDHPLFAMDFDDNNNPSPRFVSRFDEEYAITGDCFYLSLPGAKHSTVYLMCVDNPTMVGAPFTIDSYELYMVKDWKVQPLCCSTPITSMFHMPMCDLYKAVQESCNHPKIDSDIMSAMDAFMGSTADTSDLPDDLPF